MVVRHHVVLVLYKSSKCSKPPSHLSNPSSIIFRTLNSKEVKNAKKRKTQEGKQAASIYMRVSLNTNLPAVALKIH